MGRPNFATPTDPEEFVFLLLDGFTHLALSSSIEVLRVANLLSKKDLYAWSLMKVGGGSQLSSNGLETVVQSDLRSLKAGTSLYVVSGLAAEDKVTKKLSAFLRAQYRHGVNLGALCSGAYVLAEAGLLNGNTCAVHWQYYPMFNEKFPDIKVSPNAFHAQSRPFTASGGVAGAELMLHIISKAHGRDFALEIADQLVLPKVRHEDDVQRMPDHIRFGTRNHILLQSLAYMSANLEEPISTREIADNLGVSGRQIERLFRKYIGRSPGRHYKFLRLEHAKNLLATTDLAIIQIALATGFTSPSHFSKTFRAEYGETPYGFYRDKKG
jgi:transcriptional regulator GlxA family with amidase domain